MNNYINRQTSEDMSLCFGKETLSEFVHYLADQWPDAIVSLQNSEEIPLCEMLSSPYGIASLHSQSDFVVYQDQSAISLWAERGCDRKYGVSCLS